jgi:pilus assembly protein CpaB
MDALRSKSFISLGLGLLAGAIAWTYLNHKEVQLLRRGKMIEVIAANSYLPAYTRLQPRHLLRKQLPAEYVTKGTVLESSEVLGQMTLVPFNSEETFTYNKLAKNGQSLANAVPEGRRAFTVGVDKARGVNGLLRPGDLVDVLFLSQQDKNPNNAMASTLLQNIQVLAAGDLYTDLADKNETGGTVTLALTPEESELTLLALSRGILHLSLRSNEDSRIVNLSAFKAGALLGASKHGFEPPAASVENFTIRKR